jgi:hypothetical protein
MKLPPLPQFAPVGGFEQEATEVTEDSTTDHADITDADTAKP